MGESVSAALSMIIRSVSQICRLMNFYFNVQPFLLFLIHMSVFKLNNRAVSLCPKYQIIYVS